MIKVAIVEENETVRESLETITNLAAVCQCVGAWGTAKEALPMLWKLEPDVVLMDVRWPAISGVEYAVQIKKRLPAAQIILLTVYEDPDRIFGALRAGECGYLLKRSTPEQIIAAIQDAHQGGKLAQSTASGGKQNYPFGELGRSMGAATLAGEP